MSRTKHCENPLCGLPIPKSKFEDHIFSLVTGGFDGTYTATNLATGEKRPGGAFKVSLRLCKGCIDEIANEFKEKDIAPYDVADAHTLSFTEKIFAYWKEHPNKKPRRLRRLVIKHKVHS